MARWAVVKFTNEKTVEVVPFCWYVEMSNECFWPPNTVKKWRIKQLVESCSKPEEDWLVYPADLLYTCDHLSQAEKKVKKAIYTSDLSTSNSDIPKGRGLRKQKKNPRYRQEASSDTATDISSSDESEINNCPTFPRKQLGVESFTTFARGRASNSQVRSQKVNGIQENNTDNNVNSILLMGNDGKNCPNPEFAGFNAGLQETPTRERSDRGGPSTCIAATSKQCSCKDEFEKIVLNELSLLNLKLDSAIDTINTLMKIRRMEDFNKNDNRAKEIQTFYSFLPITDMEAMNKMEEWIEVQDNYNLLVSDLSRVGGNSLPQAVRALLYRVFTNEIAQLYSWEGAKKKKAFKTLRFARALLDCIKCRFPESTEHEAINVVKTWLVKAKERLTRKQDPQGQNEIREGEEQ